RPVDISATKLFEPKSFSSAILFMTSIKNGLGFDVSPLFQRIISELYLFPKKAWDDLRGAIAFSYSVFEIGAILSVAEPTIWKSDSLTSEERGSTSRGGLDRGCGDEKRGQFSIGGTRSHHGASPPERRTGATLGDM